MDLPATAHVDATDGACGRLTSIVLDPKKQAVTHLVVAEKDFPHTQRLVPINLVLETAPRTVKLRCNRHEVTALADFIESEYIQGEFPYYEGNPAFLLLEPLEIPMTTKILVEHRQIPHGELTIDRGARVEATDGHVGRLDEVVIDPGNGQVTHLVLRKGYLWGQRDVTIPVEQIAGFAEDAVFLRLNKNQVGRLPAISVQESRS